MKKTKIYILLLFSASVFFMGCGIHNNNSTNQPIHTRTNNESVITPKLLTPIKTQPINASNKTETPKISLTAILVTAQATSTPTSADIFNGKLIILRNFEVNYIEDILSDSGQNLVANGQSIDIQNWEGNGCTLIVKIKNGIVEMNLQGKIVRTIFSFERLPPITDGVILLPPSYSRRAIDLLSPDEGWVSYKVGSGIVEQVGDDRDPLRYEYENIETISVDGKEGPYQLSQRGGAWRASWSPNSQGIAYTDYDEFGIHQLYVISPDGTNRRQITYFTNPLEIMKIIWSPNGKNIALLVDKNNDGFASTVHTGGYRCTRKSRDTGTRSLRLCGQ